MIKKDEQEKRANQSSCFDKCFKETENLKNLNLPDEIIDIYNQSFYFCVPHNLYKIISSLINELSKKYTIISAIDEADLVIKNIVMTEIENKKSVIVFSRDTDYYILFSDSPAVCVSPFGLVYNPYYIWTSFLKQAYSYDMVIRISPLAGNDYSQSGLILLNTSLDTILNLCNIDDKIDLIKNEKRKKIKCLSHIDCEIGKITTPEKIDDAVFRYNEDYFKKYFSSVIIYKNWNQFNKFNIYETKNDTNFLTKIIPFEKIYNWNTELLYNWDEFFKNVTLSENIQKEFDSYQTTKSYDISDILTDI
jgi:hypothetical protein